jgi:hypothetical protein
MDSYDNFMKGTKFGEVIIPGSAITSTLYLLVAGKTVIKTWIDQGAKNNWLVV